MRMSWLSIRNGLILVMIFYAMIFGIVKMAFAEDYIIEETISESVVKRVLDFDNMVILPTTKTVVIRTIQKDLDVNGATVRQSAGPNFIYRDVEDNPETEDIDESVDDFTVFMQKLGLSKASVKQAMREMATE